MEKLTAMQELIEDLKDCKSENPFIQNTTDLIIELAELRLGKEKQQIIEACIKTTQDCWQSFSDYANLNLEFTE